MGKTLLAAAVCLLALYGCTELIGRLARRWLMPVARLPGCWVLSVSGDCPALEQWVCAAVTHARWHKEWGIQNILLVDRHMTEETRQVARRLCGRFSCVHLCPAARLPLFFV